MIYIIKKLSFYTSRNVALLLTICFFVTSHSSTFSQTSTSAHTCIIEEKLATKPTSDLLEALQGKVAGVDITTNEQPGVLGKIYIRSSHSSLTTAEPLYIVDGVPVYVGSIDFLNPRDIESVDILKDASSTAIYGSRGKNGVVLITTKKGKQGKIHLSYDGSVTFEKLTDKSPAMSASKYITWRRWAYHNANPEIYTPGNQPTYEQDIMYFSGDNIAWTNVEQGWNSDHTAWDGSKVTDTDWTDFVTGTGIINQHTLNLRGGSKVVTGAFSFGYLNNKGTQKGQQYERYTISANADFNATTWLKAGVNIYASIGNKDYSFMLLNQTNSTNLYGAAKNILRYALPYDDMGNIVIMPGGTTTNTFTIIDESNISKESNRISRAIGSFYAQLDFKDLWRSLSGLQYQIRFNPDLISYDTDATLHNCSLYSYGDDDNRTIDEKENYYSWTLDNMLLYNRTFNQHNIGLNLLWSTSNRNPTTLYTSRLTYSFRDRYLLSASATWDKFKSPTDEAEWNFSPSLSLGWNIEKESFINKVKWIDLLKARIGIGTIHDTGISPYNSMFMAMYMTNSTYFINERTTQWNLGIDFGFLHGRINGAIDFYDSSVKNEDYSQGNNYLSTRVPTLVNAITKSKRKGIELTLNTIPVIAKDFIWSSDINIAWQKDKITYFSDEALNNSPYVNESAAVYYGLDNAGLWKECDIEEMEKFNANLGLRDTKFAIGMVRPIDQNGDYKIDNNDRVILGNRFPKFIAGWTNTFSWKGIELSIELQGRFKYMINTGGEAQLGMFQQADIDYWTPQNPGAEWQKPIYSQRAGDPYYTLLGYRNVSFIKIRNLSLAYNFSKKLCERFGASSAKVYIQGKNLGMLASSVNFTDLDTGTSYYNRGFTIGLSLDF